MYHISDSLSTIPKKKQRIGRGNGSNRGKNSGKGHKGQTKRSGKVSAVFEGGKKSLVRRTPKFKGFKNDNNQTVAQLPLTIVLENYEAGDMITLASMKEKHMVKNSIKTVRIILRGELTKKVTFDSENGIHLTKGVKALIK
jgi:large subunit ribosomal protein L15